MKFKLLQLSVSQVHPGQVPSVYSECHICKLLLRETVSRFRCSLTAETSLASLAMLSSAEAQHVGSDHEAHGARALTF